MRIPVEVSARHVHLDKNCAEILFGQDYEFKIRRELSQPGQYLYEEKIDIKNGENIIKNVSVLGPFREKTQIELSLTDARKLKVSAPVRESGDVGNSAGCTLIGPKGKAEISEGIIVAKRHLHIPESLEEGLELTNGEIVKVEINTAQRSLIFDDVVARIHPNFALALHIDTDEGNAAGAVVKYFVELSKIKFLD